MKLQEIKDMLLENPEDAKGTLEAYSHTKEEGSFFLPFKEDERKEAAEDFIKESIKVSKLSDELADIKENFKVQMKPHLQNSSKLREELKNNGREEYGVLYWVDDQEDGMMHQFDENGNYLMSRKMTAKERQLKIGTEIPLNKKVS